MPSPSLQYVIAKQFDIAYPRDTSYTGGEDLTPTLITFNNLRPYGFMAFLHKLKVIIMSLGIPSAHAQLYLSALFTTPTRRRVAYNGRSNAAR